MKRIFLLLSSLLILITQTSCKRCVLCTITDGNGNEVAVDERTCGSSQQLDDARASARIRGQNLGGSANCKDE